MTEISEAAKLKACELANAERKSWGYGASTFMEPRFVGDESCPELTVLARYIQQVSDAAKLADDALKVHGIKRAASTPDGAARLALAPFILPDPVDPLLIEARKLAAERWLVENMETWGDHVLKGHCDTHTDVKLCLAALKRGMELAS